ncbi:uncharacterized protein RJT20DRAFT_131916 [Scheffersomyces xylosifermentans]|uniref:uncharacterized protein n=1 Tax=Scheffersomyces xylosifermentans TaxID=1304137 RepID=UPI00315C4F50
MNVRSFNKENEIILISQSIPSTPSPINSPLTSKRSYNSLNTYSSLSSTSNSKSPLAFKSEAGSPTRRRKPAMDVKSSPARSPSAPASTNTLNNLQKEYAKLERSYTDLILKNKTLLHDHSQLEIELHSKASIITEQAEKIASYEKFIKTLQEDHSKSSDLLTKEIAFYKELIQDLQSKIDKLIIEIETYRNNALDSPPHTPEQSRTHPGDPEDYNKLAKNYRVLQSNFELERNSKTILIDQIEYLTKEIEVLRLEQNKDVFASRNSTESDILDNSVIHDITHTIHTMNNLTEEEEDDEDLEDSVSDVSHAPNSDDDKINELDELNKANMLTYLAEELKNNHSSPIKGSDHTDDSMEISRNFQFPPPEFGESNFMDHAISQNSVHSTVSSLKNRAPVQFPPSPDPGSKEKKRQSLPSQLKSPTSERNEFVLSPFKLSNTTSTSFSDDGDHRRSSVIKRYSTTKPTHSRYNSHDIVPIKVEFEVQDSALRSTSVPESHNKKRFDIISENAEYNDAGSIDMKLSMRDDALLALNGYIPQSTSNRNSIYTNSSSKRSSMVLENFANDLTRQEIMKLKFELQSLRLHNEKLLSYIGFELQKQKKNIKKLTKKQSARSLRSSGNKKIEYSDAKLIEKSKEILIQKKRVLRSVSINAILSNKYNNSCSPATRSSGFGLLTPGISPFSPQPFAFDVAESEAESYLKDKGEDEYGFLDHNDKFGTRVFSNGLNVYLNFNECNDGIDEDDVKESEKEKRVKKYRSQVFEKTKYSSSDDERDSDVSTEVEREEEWEEITSDGSSSEEEIGMLNQIKYLILGVKSVEGSKKKRKEQSLVDDNLRYKFLTIAIGIMIIGLRFSHQTNPNVN